MIEKHYNEKPRFELVVNLAYTPPVVKFVPDFFKNASLVTLLVSSLKFFGLISGL